MGLWLAVTVMPPLALRSVTAKPTVGVGVMPISITSQPADKRAEETAILSISPEALVSLARTTLPLLHQVPKAEAYSVTVLGKKDWPTIPRNPETVKSKGVELETSVMAWT